MRTTPRRRPRHYLIDQTNCYARARVRKLASFADFGVRLCMVCLPPVEQWVGQLSAAMRADETKRIAHSAYVSTDSSPGFLSDWEFPSTETELFTDILYHRCSPAEGPGRIASYMQRIAGVLQRGALSADRRPCGNGAAKGMAPYGNGAAKARPHWAGLPAGKGMAPRVGAAKGMAPYRAQNVSGGTGVKGGGKGSSKPCVPQGSLSGTIKAWNEERGFGFVERPGEEDVF